MASLHHRKLTLWSIALIILAGTGTGVYALVMGIGHSNNNHPSAPDFTMTSSPSSQGIVQNQSGTTQILIMSQNGFTGTVSLTMTVSPGGVNGISATIVQNALVLGANKANSTSINVSTTNALLTSFNITVVGKSGSLSHQVTVSVAVLSTIRCTPGYICPGGADPLSIAVSQNSSNWQVSQITIYDYGSYDIQLYAYYYTYSNKTQLGSEHTINSFNNLAPNGFVYFQPAQPGVQVYGVTFLWQTPPPPTYTQNSQLNQSWIGMPYIATERLLLESYVFNSGTNVTMWYRNSGSATVTLRGYNVTDAAGDSYSLNNWNGPTIPVLGLAGPSITIGASCTTCTLTGSAFSFTTGQTYTITVISARNDEFPNTVTR